MYGAGINMPAFFWPWMALCREGQDARERRAQDHCSSQLSQAQERRVSGHCKSSLSPFGTIDSRVLSAITEQLPRKPEPRNGDRAACQGSLAFSKEQTHMQEQHAQLATIFNNYGRSYS